MRQIIFILVIICVLAFASADQNCGAGYTSYRTTLVPSIAAYTLPSQFLNVPFYPLICEKSNIALEEVNNTNQCGGLAMYPDKTIGYTFEFGFTLTTPTTISFRFGLDFGYGGIVLIDGVQVTSTFDDQWWHHDWTDLNEQYLTPPTQVFGVGCHHVTVIGREFCCDGNQTLQMKIGSGAWQTITPELLGSLNDVIVSTPISCIGEAFWTSLSDEVSQHWCYCNCWAPGARYPVNTDLLHPACALDSSDVEYYTRCLWECPTTAIVNSVGIMPISTWTTSCL